MFVCSIMTWAQQGEPVRKLKVKLKNGQTAEYRTDQIDRISFDGTPEEDNIIKVEEIGMTNFKFSIKTGGQTYIFAAFETGYIEQYGEEMMLATFRHFGYEDTTYDWADGVFFENEEISVRPGHNYTILAAIWPGEGVAPERIYRTDLTTVAEEQTQGNVKVTLEEVTASSVKVKAEPDTDISRYIVFVKDKEWVDMVVGSYGEAMLQSTTERAAELGQAKTYYEASEEVWTDLLPGTDYNCIVVIEDSEGKKKMDIHSFTTLQ